MAKAKKTSASSKAKNLQSLRDLDRAGLIVELDTARKSLYTLQMKHSLGELKQPHQLRSARKYVAQISTVISSAL